MEYDAVCRSSSKKLHATYARRQFSHCGKVRSQRFFRLWHREHEARACPLPTVDMASAGFSREWISNLASLNSLKSHNRGEIGHQPSAYHFLEVP